MAGINKAIVLSSTIAQEFDINYGVKLDEFSTEFATAHPAKSKTPNQEPLEYYALVFNKFFPVDLDKFNNYRSIKEKNIQELIDFGRVQTPKGEGLCCILQKPVGITLQAFLEKNGAVEENFVTSRLLNQLFSAISTLHGSNIMHGRINLHNIYLNNQMATIQLRECLSESTGFSQTTAYETLERMICHPAGKSYREYEADFYALGVTLAALISGEEVMAGMSDENIKKMKFEQGSYEAVFGAVRIRKNINTSKKAENLLHGLLHDKTKERWKTKQIMAWQKKEISQAAPSRVHKQATAPFNFRDIDYFSIKHLANDIFEHWADAKKNLNLMDLGRWIVFTSRTPDVEKRLAFMSQGAQNEVIIPDDKLAVILYVMDEEGPIRYKTLAFHPDGLGTLLAYFMYKNDRQGLDNLAGVIELGFIEGWVSVQENKELYKINELGWNPRKIKFFLKKNELGFGLERCLYELNSYLPCLSPLLDNIYAVGLPAVLSALNSGKLAGKNIDTDKHLTAYICKQIGIDDSIKIKQLQNFPYYNKALPIRYSAMFSFAQTASQIDRLPGIATWLRQALNPVVEKVKSIKLRKALTESLDEATKTGSLTELFKAVADAKIIRRDINGFGEAKRQFKVLSLEILKLRNQANLDQLAYRMGLRVSVIFAYLICAIAILSVIFIRL